MQVTLSIQSGVVSASTMCLTSGVASLHGIVATLFWEVCVVSVAFLFVETIAIEGNGVALGVAAGLGIILVPLSGWLGDCYFGRYRMVKYSLFILWALSIAYGAFEVITKYYSTKMDTSWPRFSGIFIFFIVIFTGVFIANNFFLGIDQISDAPSWQVSSYISWYACCFYATFSVKSLAFQCTDKSIAIGIAAALLTAALCLYCFSQNKIMVAPISSNCLRLIFGVLQYALKNKYPRLRYVKISWKYNQSRINLAKHDYGGPFTSEEVEDVKMFFKIILIILVCTLLPGCFLFFQTFSNQEFLYHFRDTGYRTGISHCVVRAVVSNISGYLILVGVLLYECTLYPLLRRRIASVTISKKFLVGMIILLVSWIGYLTLDVTGHMLDSNRNASIVCLFSSSAATERNGEAMNLSFYWLCIPDVLHTLAYYLLLASGLELLCAQCPGSMRGFLLGLVVSMLAVANFMNVGIKHIFTSLSSVMEKYLVSCGVAYFTFSSLCIGIIVILTFTAQMWYSKRRRGDYVAEECMEVGYEQK